MVVDKGKAVVDGAMGTSFLIAVSDRDKSKMRYLVFWSLAGILSDIPFSCDMGHMLAGPAGASTAGHLHQNPQT